MDKKLKPLFIFSLVRSGSTLLQKLLMTHDKIDSTAETWILLPLVASLKKNGLVADYDHSIANVALMDVIKNLPNKSDDYHKFLNEFALNIYNGLSNGKNIYFIDKTPRYFMIIPEIIKIFPDAKFIFLFRNPVHIYASIISTWRNYSLKYSKFIDYDLTYGPLILSKEYLLIKGKSYALQYENLVRDPEKYLKEIMNYLDLDYDRKMINDFYGQDLKGESFDPTGTLEYQKVSKDSLEKWKSVFNSPYRKKVLLNFIKNMDDDVFKIQGYDKIEIINEIENIDLNGKHNFLKDFLDFNLKKIKKNVFIKRKRMLKLITKKQ